MGFCQQVSGPFAVAAARRPVGRRLDAAEDLDQVRPGRVPQPVGDRRRVRAPAADRRPARGSASIEIATFRTAVEIIGQDPEKWRPKTRETADHSLPYCTAVALVDGAVTADQFTAERLADPALLDLVARTTVVEDPALTAGYPAGHPQPGQGDARRRHRARRGGRLPARPRQEPARPTPSSPSSSTAWPTRRSAPSAPTRLWERLSRLEDDPRPHEAIAPARRRRRTTDRAA